MQMLNARTIHLDHGDARSRIHQLLCEHCYCSVSGVQSPMKATHQRHPLSMGAADASLSSVIEHRSQSSNNARKVAGEFGYVHLRDQDEWYARSASAFEYQRTFRSD